MEPKQVRIEVEDIGKLAIASKKVVTETGVKYVTRISFEGDFKIGQVARLNYLNKQGKPINVTFESLQAEFDLNISPFKVETGELAPSELPEYLK